MQKPWRNTLGFPRDHDEPGGGHRHPISCRLPGVWGAHQHWWKPAAVASLAGLRRKRSGKTSACWRNCPLGTAI